ncbi:NUDIX hydrolase [Streptomyces evansiae]|uniref:NUDIX hydrolase n=1 Tax=Streptomyces evansiae TaxID=3075535 RepID=UPI002884F41E|nr:NUDIX hydrolase [Streptomyces sp. DSM 41859]MDT0420278.1 NUDIX hydrolase [Streptomyces sp. DSM 41859]
MPLSPAALRPLVDTYLARHPEDRPALTGLLALLSDDSGERFPAARTTLPGHVTCGAVVIDRARRVLHIGHRSSGLTLTPGGHAEEADASLLAVAVREVGEETGLPASRLCLTPYALDAPFDIDVHAIDARPEKGEPAHEHYDFRFLFYLTDDAPPVLALQEEEVTGATWLPFPEIRSTTLRAKLLAAERELDGTPQPLNASLLLHDGHGRYLLHLRDMREGIWEPGAFALLGGGREPGDDGPEATLRRELGEEVPGLVPTGLSPYEDQYETSPDGLSVPVRVYEGRWSGPAESLDLREGVLVHWFAPEDLDRLRLTPGLAGLIRRHAAGRGGATGRCTRARC